MSPNPRRGRRPRGKRMFAGLWGAVARHVGLFLLTLLLASCYALVPIWTQLVSTAVRVHIPTSFCIHSPGLTGLTSSVYWLTATNCGPLLVLHFHSGTGGPSLAIVSATPAPVPLGFRALLSSSMAYRLVVFYARYL